MGNQCIECVERVARIFGVSKHRVSIDFRIHEEQDGGPTWSISVLVPNKDRRKADHRVHAAAATLDEAEKELLATLAPPKDDSRARMIEELFADGTITAEQRDSMLARAGGRS